MTTVVVDANVILVAKAQHAAVSEECVAACARRLNDVVQAGRVAIKSILERSKKHSK